MGAKRGNPTGRIGNYAARVDESGMDPEMKGMMFGTKMTKLESDYVKGTGRASSVEAVKRARKANKQRPLRPEV